MKNLKANKLSIYFRYIAGSILIISSAFLLQGCFFGFFKKKVYEKPFELIELETTGYCHCPKCTGWKRNIFFQAVYAYGPSKGKRKKVGITYDGTRVKRGVIAADLKLFPLGTRFEVPGYGYGIVRDRGSHIIGKHIDLYFETHSRALKWGRRVLKVKVWKEENMEIAK